MKKKLLVILGVLLVVLLCAATATHSAYAADIVASGTCGAEGDGSNLTWTLDSDGVLTISGTGAMKNYTSSSRAPWYSRRDKIISVAIDSGVTSIGNYAFYGCTGLT